MTVIYGFDGGILGGEWGPLSYSGETMDLNHWADDAWKAGSWRNPDWGGIGLVEEGIGLARVGPVDFVLQPREWSRDLYRDRLQLIGMEKQREAKRERAELREMMALYGSWRKAA